MPGYLQKRFHDAYCLTAQTLHNNNIDIVTCTWDNLQVLSPGHHSTLTVPDPLPSPADHKE